MFWGARPVRGTDKVRVGREGERGAASSFLILLIFTFIYSYLWEELNTSGLDPSPSSPSMESGPATSKSGPAASKSCPARAMATAGAKAAAPTIARARRSRARSIPYAGTTAPAGAIAAAAAAAKAAAATIAAAGCSDGNLRHDFSDANLSLPFFEPKNGKQLDFV